MTHVTFFKHDMKSRVDERMEDEANETRDRRRWDAEIDRRDGKRCRACGRHSDPDRIGLTTRGHRAHIVYASAGGSWEPFNRVTLCFACHNDEHKDRLRFTEDGGPYVGIDARQGMEFWRKNDELVWYLSRRELSPGVPEKD